MCADKPERAEQAPVLVFLDLQRPPGGQRPRSAASAAGERLLAHARRAGWNIVHVYRNGGDGRGCSVEKMPAPIPGFEPRPSEAVYVRQGVSAFSSARFAEIAEAARGGEIIVAGLDLTTSGLATAFEAHDRGVPITLVRDAFFVSPLGGVEPGVLEQILWKLVAPFARLSSVDAVVTRRASIANDM